MHHERLLQPQWLLRFRQPLDFSQCLRRTITTATTIAEPPSLHPSILHTTENALPRARLPKLIITPGSIHHNSLETYLAYAARRNLSPAAKVFVGTHYEYTVALSLLRLGFSLIRTGGRADAGIDLIGHWTLPPLPFPLPVIVQCKAGKLTAQYMRELEGSFQGVPPDWRRKDVFGLLVSTHKATRGVLEGMQGSKLPMGFLKVSNSGVVEQLLWNRVAGEKGLEGVGVTARHTPGVLGLEKGTPAKRNGIKKGKKSAKVNILTVRKDVQLTWMGQPIFPVRQELDPLTAELGEEIAANSRVSGPKRKPGRPKGSKTMNIAVGKKLGRPYGSKSNKKASTDSVDIPKRRGRPKGSTRKSETVEDSEDRLLTAEVRKPRQKEIKDNS